MTQVSDYISLIPSQNQTAPKFVAMVSLLAQAFVDEQETLADAAFDLDTAIGQALDYIGQWVGLSRNVSGVYGAPLPVYFSFDTANLGFDQGQIYAPIDVPSGVTAMDDVTYRFMLRVKIAANNWDGTLGQLQSILLTLLPYSAPNVNGVVDENGTQVQAYNPAVTTQDNLVQSLPSSTYVFIQDNKDMSMSLYLGGILPSALTMALLTGNYFALKPAGVKQFTFIPSNLNSSFFGFDTENQYIAGFDQSALALSIG